MNSQSKLPNPEQGYPKLSGKNFSDAFDLSPIGIELFDSEGVLIGINRAALEIFGIKDEESVKSFRLFDDPNLSDELKENLRSGMSVKTEIEFDFAHVKEHNLYETAKRGIHYLELDIMPCKENGTGKTSSYIAYVRDITEKKYEENEKAAALEILRIINRTPGKQELIRKVTLFLKRWLGCEAIAIRLREGFDFPYYETSGFSEKFVKLEKYLCAYDKLGSPVCDAEGQPVLECMCGQVLLQKTVPDKTYFTRHGSFWTNSTTELAPTLKEGELPETTRGRCVNEMYESIGLFPLRFNNETFGLLQINDRKPGLFTPRILDFLEVISDKIVLALMKKRAEEALAESESRFRSFVENASDMLYSLNAQGLCTYMSPNLKDILGYEPSELYGHFIGEFSEPEYSEKLREFFKDTLKQSKNQAELEFTVRHKDGSLRWHATRQSLIFDEQGGIKSVLGITRDITDRKNYEMQLENYSEELKSINAAKDRLFSILAHDLRGPFAGFLGITKEMMENAEDLQKGEISEMAAVMHSTADKIYNLLNNLLEWSRLQINRINFEQNPMYLRAEADNALELFVSAAALKSINLRNLIAKETIVMADNKMLSTVLRNLISNSIKFTGAGGTVTVSSAYVGSYIEVSVSDTGVGMDSELMKKLFRIDYVVSTRGTGNERGSGLGLILCKEMMEKNGGELSVRSTPGQGTTFSFTLPAAENPD